MKLHEFLTTSGRIPAPTRSVSWKAIAIDQAGVQISFQVNAVLVFVSEHERQEALRDAMREMRKAFGEQPIPPSQLSDEETYQFLRRALRDSDNHKEPLCGSVIELRRSLTEDTARTLYIEYARFTEEEFPPIVDDATFKQLVEEAKKNSLPDLLSSGNWEQTRRALPGLVAYFVKQRMQTSGDSGPAT